MKRWCLNLTLFVFSTTASVLLAEVLARAIDPRSISSLMKENQLGLFHVVSSNPLLGYELPGNLRVQLGKTYSTNRFGFRGPEIRMPKDPARKRILLLGDSVVLGQSVNDGEEFAAVMRRLLEGSRAEVINTGVSSYNLVSYHEVLRTKGLQLDPDIVVAIIISNDGQLNEAQLEYLEANGFPSEVPEAFSFPARGSSIVKRPQQSVFSLPYLRATVAYLSYIYGEKYHRWLANYQKWDGHLRIPKSHDGWKYAVEALRRIDRLCKARDIPFVAFSERYSSELEAYTLANDIQYVPLRFGELKAQKLELMVNASDSHPSALGHQWIAKKVVEVLGQQNVLQ